MLTGSAAAALAFGSRAAEAARRREAGGALSLRLPWSLDAIDPHDLADASAALLADLLFDSLYAVDDDRLVCALASAMPQRVAGGLRVPIRGGLVTAAGRPLDARDAIHSIERARRAGATAWLSTTTPPKLQGDALFFAGNDAVALARVLSSPLTAIVPRDFRPTAPDGTGPMSARRTSSALELTKNPTSATGPSLIARVTVATAGTLADSLRAFESGADDVGWLGTGLHEPRSGATRFDHGLAGLLVLVPGRDTAGWDAPGVVQRLCDAVPPQSLAFLGLGPPWAVGDRGGWGGPRGPLVVRSDSPHLVETARTLAATLSRPGHELVVEAVSAAELSRRRQTRAFTLALDVVRTLDPSPLGMMVSLATADHAERARDVVRHPPRLGAVGARALTRTMRLGVVGELRVAGGAAAHLTLRPRRPGTLGLADATVAHKP